MKLARLGPRGAEIPAVLHRGVYYDLSGLTTTIDGDFLGKATEGCTHPVDAAILEKVPVDGRGQAREVVVDAAV